jgi:hypothetical protein
MTSLRQRRAGPVCKQFSSIQPCEAASTYPASRAMLPAKMETQRHAERPRDDQRGRAAIAKPIIENNATDFILFSRARRSVDQRKSLVTGT